MSSFLFPRAASAQNRVLESVDVYLDCESRTCDFDYIRREIPYVNYVRERKDAYVHLLVTTERTGSGGRAFKLNFIGLKEFSALSDTLRYTSSGTDTDDERRAGLVKKMAEGLVRYISRTSLADRMVISVPHVSEAKQTTFNPPDDPWKSWYFGISLSGDYKAEETSNNGNVRARLSANRTTEEWKLIFSAGINYRERNFDVGDQTVTSITESESFWAYVVKSIAPKWSFGFSSFTDTSTRQNRKLSSSLAPAIEFSLFPYSESNLRQVTIVYELRFQTVEYKELTVFDKTSEKLLSQSLKLNLDYRQPWGSANAVLAGSNFLTDFESSRTKFYSVEVGGSMSVRLVRGLNVNIGFSYDVVKDQLFLVKKELTEDEILLGTKRLPTSFEYEFRMGFSYNFGSIYNNVVNSRMNPRF